MMDAATMCPIQVGTPSFRVSASGCRRAYRRRMLERNVIFDHVDTSSMFQSAVPFIGRFGPDGASVFITAKAATSSIPVTAASRPVGAAVGDGALRPR